MIAWSLGNGQLEFDRSMNAMPSPWCTTRVGTVGSLLVAIVGSGNGDGGGGRGRPLHRRERNWIDVVIGDRHIEFGMRSRSVLGGGLIVLGVRCGELPPRLDHGSAERRRRIDTDRLLQHLAECIREILGGGVAI